MTQLDPFTKEMLTNPNMLKVNQESTNNRQISRDRDLIVWAADIPNSPDKYVALFNARSLEERAGGVVAIAEAGGLDPGAAAGGTDSAGSANVAGDGAAAEGGAVAPAAADGAVAPTVEGGLDAVGGAFATATAAEGCLDPGAAGDPAAGMDTTVTIDAVGLVRAAAPDAAAASCGCIVAVDLSAICIQGPARVTDLWHQKDLGIYDKEFSREIPFHGAGLYRVSPVR